MLYSILLQKTLRQVHEIIRNTAGKREAAKEIGVDCRTLTNYLNKISFKDGMLSYETLKELKIEEAEQKFGAIYARILEDILPPNSSQSFYVLPKKNRNTTKKRNHDSLISQEEKGLTSKKLKPLEKLAPLPKDFMFTILDTKDKSKVKTLNALYVQKSNEKRKGRDFDPLISPVDESFSPIKLSELSNREYNYNCQKSVVNNKENEENSFDNTVTEKLSPIMDRNIIDKEVDSSSSSASSAEAKYSTVPSSFFNAQQQQPRSNSPSQENSPPPVTNNFFPAMPELPAEQTNQNASGKGSKMAIANLIN